MNSANNSRSIFNLFPGVFLILAVTLIMSGILTSCQPQKFTIPSVTIYPAKSDEPSSSPYTIIETYTIQPTETFTPSPSPEPVITASITSEPAFSFVVNGDTAYHAGSGEMDTSQYFRGMAESIAKLPDVRFMITAGDISPAEDTRWTIDQVLGKDFLWFPVVGNHDLNSADFEWLHRYDYEPVSYTEPSIVRTGPGGCEQTTYSFDYENSHFAILNVYCDTNNEKRTDGAIVNQLYEWLKNDLQMTQKEHIFVIGHEPAYPQPDTSAEIIRQVGESLDKYPVTRDRFWALLKEYGVAAYITGHTHSYSIVDIDGVWQIDVAHSMGARTQSTRSTYVVIHIQGNEITYDTWRVNNYTDQYELFESGELRE